MEQNTIDNKILPLLHQIDFSDRYKKLSVYQEYKRDLLDFQKETFDTYFTKANIRFSFSKRESFYKLIEKVNEFTLQLNIIPHNGYVQFIWSLKYLNDKVRLGFGMWENLTDIIDSENNKKETFVRKPLFIPN